MMKTRSIVTSIVIAVAAIGITAPAQAETFAFASGPLTNLDPAGATINGGFTAFPTKAGMYIQQCVAPVGMARPATCSDTIQLWVTAAGGPGTTSPTGPIAIKVAGSITGKGVTIDCTKVQCGLFFRLDHTAPTDFSEDKFLPITFKQGTATPAPTLAADEITVTLNGMPLVRNVPSNLAYRADAKIVATAKSGAVVTLTSLTPDCTYVNGQFTALKGSGQCALAYSTVATATTAAASGNFPFILVPGEQKIALTSLVVAKGKKKALPATTNFGNDVSYSSNSKNCRVEANLVAVNGPCTLTATAADKAGMWGALKTTIKVKNK
jgi:hypothetical protein